MKVIIIVIAAVVALAQWLVPGSMIWKREQILAKGETFRFRTEPVDPSHPFKGRYIVLSFKENVFTAIKPDSNLGSAGEVFVLLDKDKDGFATIRNVVKEEPSANSGFVKANISYINTEGDTSTIHLDYPFQEFYMDEFKAPKAEAVYRESVTDSTQRTYAVVSALNGEAVIKDVMINEKPIRQVVKEMK